MSGLLIITGPPGAGKSTVATLAGEAFDPSIVVAGDAFFGFLASGAIEPWLPASNHQNGVVTDAAAAATGRFVTGGYTTIYDGILGPWFVDRFVRALRLDQSGPAAVDYAIILPSVEACIHRVATRTGHGFTDEVATRKMHHEFATAAVDGRHLFAGDEDGAAVTLSRILEARADGRLRYRAP